jgi:UDP-glucose 4-epimerase
MGNITKINKNKVMEKIVITGGLGYIGTELCKLYSGETRYKNIIVTDKKFISERVKQLRDWGFEFIPLYSCCL